LRRTAIAVAAIITISLASPRPAPGQSDRHPRAEAFLRYSVARLLEVQGAYDAALTQYLLAQSHDPGHCGMGTAIARVQARLGRVDEAEATVLRVRARCPRDAEALGTHADVLLSTGRYAELEEVVSDTGRSPYAPLEFLILLCESLIALDRPAEAVSLCRERCRADSLSPVLAFLHARVLLRSGDHEAAAAELLRAERLDPENRAVTVTLGEVLVALGRPEEGARRMERAVARASAGDREHATLARAYADMGAPERAVRHVREALAERGESGELLAALGAAQFSAGDVEGAFDTYERLLERDPDEVVALNFVAYVLAEEDRELDRALEYAERAARLAPTASEVRDTLGWVYYRLGRFEEARGELELAATLDEPSADTEEHLGDTLMALGLVEEARAAWRRALELEPDRESALRRLEAGDETGDPRP